MVLETRGLVHYYGRRKVLESVNIRATSGEIVGLLGPNGAGKTTCFRLMAGLLRPFAGDIFLDGAKVTTTAIFKRARLGLGYLPQESSIFRSLTVAQNILIALSAIGHPKSGALKRAGEILEEYQLAHLGDQPSHTLSGGERRRLEIARAITAEPKILMLDEPFTGVDPITVDELRAILGGLKKRGIGIVLTDHNARETLKVIDRSYLIHSGKILIEGDAATLLKDERARRLYLGWEMTL